MNAKLVYDEEGKPLGAAYCSNCNRIWESSNSAERCCVCSYCGKLKNWDGGTSHSECFDAAIKAGETAKMDKAKLIEDYGGPFLIDDRYFETADELIEHFESNDTPVPEFVHCARYEAPVLDLETILQDLQENDMHEDWEPEACAPLAEAVADWNRANAWNGTWFEDTSRKAAMGLLKSQQKAAFQPLENVQQPTKIKLPRGSQAKLARDLGVHPARISMVLAGKAVSARISAAIERELARARGTK
jgi:hypothetical protein